MDDKGKGCFVLIFIYLAYGILFVISGILAWNWVAPDGFLGVILFLVAWAILFKIGMTLVFFLLGLISD